MTERDIQRGIMQAFRAAGWKVWRLQAGTARGGRTHMAEKGAPDLVCLGPNGRTLLVECKRPAGKLSEEQGDMQWWCRRAGHAYRVMRGVEDVEEAMR